MASVGSDVSPSEHKGFYLPSRSDILKLEDQQQPTRGGKAADTVDCFDATILRDGCSRCTLAVISEKGRKLKDFPVETYGQAEVEAIRMVRGHDHPGHGRRAAECLTLRGPEPSCRRAGGARDRAEPRPQGRLATGTAWRRSSAWATSTTTSSRRPDRSPYGEPVTGYEASIQIGEDQARSRIVAGTRGSGSIPRRIAS